MKIIAIALLMLAGCAIDSEDVASNEETTLSPSRVSVPAQTTAKKTQDEVVAYTGHARYGSGPDFDHKEKGGNN